MIRSMKPEEIDKVMTIWTKGNFQSHYFIERDYWLLKFNKVKNEYIPKADTFVYVENNGNEDEIKGFISINKKKEIGAFFIKEEYQHQGIGKKLVNYCKDKYKTLEVKVYEKNIEAVIFYRKMEFKNMGIEIEKKTEEKLYTLKWEEE